MDDMQALALGRALLAALAEKAEEEEVARTKARKRRRFPPELRLRLLVAQNHRCGRCMGPIGYYDSHIDHVIPLAAGGMDVESNMALLHASCNMSKGARVDDGQERMPWA